jgi:hypothetical protein
MAIENRCTDTAKGDDDETFKTMVLYFWEEKGDVERYCFWSEERCAKVWPAFFHAWKQYKAAECVLAAVAKSA